MVVVLFLDCQLRAVLLREEDNKDASSAAYDRLLVKDTRSHGDAADDGDCYCCCPRRSWMLLLCLLFLFGRSVSVNDHAAEVVLR